MRISAWPDEFELDKDYEASVFEKIEDCFEKRFGISIDIYEDKYSTLELAILLYNNYERGFVPSLCSTKKKAKENLSNGIQK